MGAPLLYACADDSHGSWPAEFDWVGSMMLCQPEEVNEVGHNLGEEVLHDTSLGPQWGGELGGEVARGVDLGFPLSRFLF
jgi:hypothetical protein